MKDKMRGIWESAKTQTDIVGLRIKKKTAVNAIEAELAAAQQAENAAYTRLGQHVFELNGNIEEDPETRRLLEDAAECRRMREDVEARLTHTVESYDAQIASLSAAPRAENYAVCPSCGANNPATDAFCTSCGARLHSADADRPSGQVCSSCGTVNADDAVFCVACGTKLPPAPTPTAEPAVVCCAVCGAQNPMDSMFCMSCGQRLVAAAPHQSAAGETPQ